MLHLLRNEAVAAELCSCISSLKREWVVLSKMEFSLILILYSSAATAGSRVSRQNYPHHQFILPAAPILVPAKNSRHKLIETTLYRDGG